MQEITYEGVALPIGVSFFPEVSDFKRPYLDMNKRGASKNSADLERAPGARSIAA